MSAEFWKAAPPPPTKLGIYRRLSTSAGVHVSPIVLGAGSIGSSDEWAAILGPMNKEMGFKLLDAYYDAGGNFIDLGNFYQNGTSEEFVGEWAEKRDVRDQLFIATKYTANYKRACPEVTQKALYVGNSAKSLHLSLRDSLQKLRTTYIDLLYVHWWDYETSIEEVMRSLHAVVQAGKVLYLGVSNTPAWIVSSANRYARDHALTPFCVYQGEWNVMVRDFERDIIPMARHEGMAIAPWAVLAEGQFRTDAEEERRAVTGEHGRKYRGPDSWRRTEREKKVSAVLEKVAKDVGAKHITAVAIAYLMHKAPYVFPIIGGRKVEQLYENLEALDVSLTPEHIKELESAVPFELGSLFASFGNELGRPRLITSAAHFEPHLLLQPYPHKPVS